MTYEEVMQCFNSLSDKDKAKVKNSLSVEESEEQNTAEQSEEVAEGIEQGELAESKKPAEQPNATESKEDNEPIQGAEAEEQAVKEQAIEDSDEVKENVDEVAGALASRITAIESKMDKLLELLKVVEDTKGGEFGVSSKMQADNSNGYADRDKQVMDSYYKGNKSAYMQ